MTTITEVSRTLEVSTRMLRYYEQQGLIMTIRDLLHPIKKRK